jgi:hypothetical protein
VQRKHSLIFNHRFNIKMEHSTSIEAKSEISTKMNRTQVVRLSNFILSSMDTSEILFSSREVLIPPMRVIAVFLFRNI